MALEIIRALVDPFTGLFHLTDRGCRVLVRWCSGRFPLSTNLSEAIRCVLTWFGEGFEKPWNPTFWQLLAAAAFWLWVSSTFKELLARQAPILCGLDLEARVLWLLACLASINLRVSLEVGQTPVVLASVWKCFGIISIFKKDQTDGFKNEGRTVSCLAESVRNSNSFQKACQNAKWVPAHSTEVFPNVFTWPWVQKNNGWVKGRMFPKKLYTFPSAFLFDPWPVSTTSWAPKPQTVCWGRFFGSPYPAKRGVPKMGPGSEIYGKANEKSTGFFESHAKGQENKACARSLMWARACCEEMWGNDVFVMHMSLSQSISAYSCKNPKNGLLQNVSQNSFVQFSP